MKTIAIGLLGWLTAATAAPLDGMLSCARELLPQSHGALMASRTTPGLFALASHTEIDVYSQGGGAARVTTYTYPERALMTDDGDRAYFLTISSGDAAHPFLLTVLQSNDGNWLDENTVPSVADTEKYLEPVAVPGMESRSEQRLRDELRARLGDFARYRAEWHRRFPTHPRQWRLDRCAATGDAEIDKAVAAARESLAGERQITSASH